MTPDQRQKMADFYDEVNEAITGTGRHAGHDMTQTGVLAYCECGLRIGQAQVDDLMRIRRRARRPEPDWARHRTVPRPDDS